MSPLLCPPKISRLFLIFFALVVHVSLFLCSWECRLFTPDTYFYTNFNCTHRFTFTAPFSYSSCVCLSLTKRGQWVHSPPKMNKEIKKNIEKEIAFDMALNKNKKMCNNRWNGTHPHVQHAFLQLSS